MYGLWNNYYAITYSTQKKNSLEPALLKMEYIDCYPLDYIQEKKKSDPNINFSLIYCESISKKQYKKYLV
jgi:hypothetical protein